MDKLLAKLKNPWKTEIDDIVFCIDNNKKIMYHETINPISLTIGKAYKVTETSQYGFYYTITIIDDSGKKADYRLDRFLKLKEWRQKQLNKLLNG